jgi:hypothetical protein
VPTLIATGQDDFIFCGALTPCTSAGVVRAREAPNFSPAACLSTYVLPGAGHDINLERNAPDWFAAADRWVGDVVDAEASGAPNCARIPSSPGETAAAHSIKVGAAR